MSDKTSVSPATTPEPSSVGTTEVLLHLAARPAPCQHDFQGWREFEDGRGGETVCKHCGLGAMAWTLRNDFT